MNRPSRFLSVLAGSALWAALALPAAAQVQNPTTLNPSSPQNQCVPTHKTDQASQTNGSPTQTTVSNGIGSAPCQYNTKKSGKRHHRHHHHHKHSSTMAMPSSSPRPR
jgi:hypothetical protein